jgi:RNA polymerase sigma factor for flagellar operon FliA
MPLEDGLESVWAVFLKRRDAESRETLAKAYYSVVDKESRRLLSRLPLEAYRQKKEDLVSAGGLGLLLALDHFTPPPGCTEGPGRAFEAYARYRIRGQMLDELRQLDFARRNLRKASREIQDAEEKLRGLLGREPREVETTESLGWTLEEFHARVAEINTLNLLSLDARAADSKDGRAPWEAALADPGARDALADLETRERLGMVRKALEGLGESEQKVLHLYYVENLTFKEIGKILVLSESRVCQVHHLAVFRIQTAIDRGSHDRAQGHGRLHDHHQGK